MYSNKNNVQRTPIEVVVLRDDLGPEVLGLPAQLLGLDAQ